MVKMVKNRRGMDMIPEGMSRGADISMKKDHILFDANILLTL